MVNMKLKETNNLKIYYRLWRGFVTIMHMLVKSNRIEFIQNCQNNKGREIVYSKVTHSSKDALTLSEREQENENVL